MEGFLEGGEVGAREPLPPLGGLLVDAEYERRIGPSALLGDVDRVIYSRPAAASRASRRSRYSSIRAIRPSRREAMSRNLDVIRRAIESLEEWGLPPECFDPEVEYTTQPDAANYTTYLGLSGLERSQMSVREAWRSIRAEPREFIEGDGVVVALIHFELRAHSGIELQQDQGWAYWMRHGRIRRMEQYATKREALEAAGLRE